MPPFELHLDRLGDDDRRRAVDAVARRFPEVEPLDVRAGECGVVWRCRAPAVEHLERWVASVGLVVVAITPADDAAISSRPPPTGG